VGLQDFSEKLSLVLKLLSISRSTLALQLGVDKSVISRWVGGDRAPSAHNLARLSSFIATYRPGFCTLDWERDADGLAAMFGLETERSASPGLSRSISGLPIDNLEQLVQASASHARAYEGFFSTTRADPMLQGCYLREHAMIRQDENGLLRITMGSAISMADGWVMPHQSLVYIIVTERRSGALLFGMFHNRPVSRIEVLDGLVLIPGADMGRSPTACAMICERIGDLSGDVAGDETRLGELTSRSQAIAAGSLPDDIREHLTWGSGPAQLAGAGEWLFSLTLNRSRTRGRQAASPAEKA
jgi:transcriptional regulator with XRE-family HTH domain